MKPQSIGAGSRENYEQKSKYMWTGVRRTPIVGQPEPLVKV